MGVNFGTGGGPASNAGWNELLAFVHPPPNAPRGHRADRHADVEVPPTEVAIEGARPRDAEIAACPAFDDTAHFAITLADWWTERRDASAALVRRADEAREEAEREIESRARDEMERVTSARQRVGAAWRDGARVASESGLDAARLLELRPGARDGMDFDSAPEMLEAGSDAAVRAAQELRVASGALAALRAAQRESVAAEHARAVERHEAEVREAQERVAGSRAAAERRLRLLWNVVAALLLLASAAWVAHRVVEQERWVRELLRGTSMATWVPSTFALAGTNAVGAPPA